MSKIDKQTDSGVETMAPSKQGLHPNHSTSRRRLIKFGTAAVPVVATLASRPALAWDCRSPSAWGSIVLNPTTSLQTSSRGLFQDECWNISLWASNTARSTLGKPWDRLFVVNSSIKNACSSSSSNVTIAMLTAIGINVAGYTPATAKVRYVLGSGSSSTTPPTIAGTAFQKAVITAQLNFIAASGLTGNKMTSCLSLANLNTMATGTYKPSSGVTWGPTEIQTYLQNYWFAKP